MRKFRFIGDSSEYVNWENAPVKNAIYSEEELNRMRGNDGYYLNFLASKFKEDFQEVFESKTGMSGNVFIGSSVVPSPLFTTLEIPKTLHKDTDLGHFAGVILSSMFNDNGFVDSENEMCKNAISYAEELIRQLNEKTNGKN